MSTSKSNEKTNSSQPDGAAVGDDCAAGPFSPSGLRVRATYVGAQPRDPPRGTRIQVLWRNAAGPGRGRRPNVPQGGVVHAAALHVPRCAADDELQGGRHWPGRPALPARTPLGDACLSPSPIVATCSSGRDALDLLKHKQDEGSPQFDLILSDVYMPGARRSSAA